jgi:PEP-CTERM motif
MRNLFIGLSASLAFIAPAQASVVFTDNFNAENGGNTALNYTSFANFASSGGGFVDLVKTGDFGIACAGGSGACVDLDGSPGPGQLTSIASFSFNAGDTIRLSYSLSGNQRVGGPDQWYSGFSFGSSTTLNGYGFNYFGSDITVGNFVTTSINTSTATVLGNGFTTKSLFFTAGNAGSLKFFIGTNSADNIGPILDNVSLDIGAAVPEPATWAMMILGFGVIGMSLRRRGAAALPA